MTYTMNDVQALVEACSDDGMSYMETCREVRLFTGEGLSVCTTLTRRYIDLLMALAPITQSIKRESIEKLNKSMQSFYSR